ncbi:hypothetical protein LTR49_028097 [Elasticomyces elasticus]|nr:hypothetical protein LTR49_028097 [Elasticomyces elasticus]
MIGFIRCFRLEHPDVRLVVLDLDPDIDDAGAFNGQVLATVLLSSSFDPTLSPEDVESELSERDGQLYVARIMPEPIVDDYVRRCTAVGNLESATFLDRTRPMKLEMEVPGLLDTFRWRDYAVVELAPDEVQLELRAASINFRDVLVASGQLGDGEEMQNDCSGVVIAVGHNMKNRFQVGDRICAYSGHSYNNFPIVHGDCCALIPVNSSFEVAASWPIVWVTALYSLFHVARGQRGESILIHAAAGAVGQAAIILSQYLGLEIYATAGSREKRALLTNIYGIPADHVFSSRTTAFVRGLKHRTSGRGVDIVLNSLSGDLLHESCNVLAPFGRFVEIGKKDYLDDALLPTKFLMQNICFAFVDLVQIIACDKPLARKLLHEVVALFAAGTVPSTEILTMPLDQLEAAFRLMQAGKHTGKIVLQVDNSVTVKAVARPPISAHFPPNAVYVVVGGFGGLGQAIITWMVDRGARNFAVISRSTATVAGAQTFLQGMESAGVSIFARPCDVGSKEDLHTWVHNLPGHMKLEDVRGVVHAAMSLQDCAFENMSEIQWQSALNAKVTGTQNLHDLLLPVPLAFFVMLSSAVVLSDKLRRRVQLPGLFARWRRHQGLPAYSINVGAVVEVGFVSERPDIAMTLRRQGLGTVTVAELLAHFQFALAHSSPASSPSDPGQCAIGLVPGGSEAGLGRSIWMNNTRFRSIAQSIVSSAAAHDASDLLSTEGLANAANIAEAEEVLCRAVIQQLGKLICMPAESISASQSLDDYGVDSLVAVELRNWVATYLQANIPLLAMRETKSIRELAHVVARESRLVDFE